MLDIAAPELEVERNIGALAALEVLEIGESAGGLELLVHQDPVLGSVELVEHRRQLLVFGNDLLDRLLRDMRIGCQHHRNRLADIMHLADGEDRLVVEGGAIIGVRDDLADVIGGDDAIDAGQLGRAAHVDRLDAAVSDGAAEDFGVQHARQLHGVGIFGAAGDLLARLEPRQRAADLGADRTAWHGGHR